MRSKPAVLIADDEVTVLDQPVGERIIGVTASSDGRMFVLASDGRVFERRKDTSNHNGFRYPWIWALVEPPAQDDPVAFIGPSLKAIFAVTATGRMFERDRDPKQYNQGKGTEEFWVWREIKSPLQA